MSDPEQRGRVVVTGSAGFVGSRVVAHLGERVSAALVREPVEHLPRDLQVPLDLARDDDDALASALEDASAVVHLAGHNEVVARHEPVRALTETLTITRRLADAAERAGVERFVYLSTIHVYGEAITDGAVLTEDVPPAPQATYAVSRFVCEHLLAHSPLDVVTLRLSNAVGAPVHPEVDRWTLVAADLCRSAALGRELVLRTPGLQSRDFISLDDVCRVIEACCEPGRVSPGTYNLGTGRPTQVRELAEQVVATFERLTGQRPTLTAPPAEGDPPAPYRVAVDRLADQGLLAAGTLAEAVDELARFCLDHKDAL